MKARVTALLVCVALAVGWWVFEVQRTHTVVVTNDAEIILPEQVTLIAGLRDT